MHTDAALDHLREGIHRFQTEVYPQHSEAYRTAATTPQKPHTLIIACADSRIDVETITSSGPGQIFFSRNVGNVVPPYGEESGGVAAVIEYAVNALKVKHVVVCGHADCGAMKALKTNDPKTGETLPMVSGWLKNAADARTATAQLASEVPLHTLTEQNVLLQLEHLKTHPAVQNALASGAITTSGWIYDIATGDVLIHDPETGHFESTLNAGTPAAGGTAA